MLAHFLAVALSFPCVVYTVLLGLAPVACVFVLVGVARFAVLLLAPVLALPFTSIAVRPLARIFVPSHATKHENLVGKVCTVRTGTVTDRFGEALLEDGGAGLVVRVRVDTGETLK